MNVKRCSIAFCSLGVAGLIVEHNKQKVTYADGNHGYAYTGHVVHDTLIKGIGGHEGKLISVKKGNQWCSKHPEFITEVDIDVDKPIDEQVEDAHKALMYHINSQTF